MCLRSCRYKYRKQSLSLLHFAREQQTLFRVHSLRALSLLHFEEAFVVVVVVVSEEARFCLRSLFLIV